MIKTSNPALGAKTFDIVSSSPDVMTIQGTVNKCLLLISLVIASAYFSWQSAFPESWSQGALPIIPGWYLPAALGAFVVALVIIFVKTTAPYLTPLYAIMEGLLLGAISAVFEFRYPGIVLQAMFCTLGTFLALLIAYKSRLIAATENFKLGVTAATGGVAIVYLIDIGLRFFGMNVPFIHENGTLGIAVSLFVTIVAALNLVLDFDFIEKGAEKRAPKYMEWYAAFGLLVTLIWLYLEILKLLSKSRKK